MKHIKFTGAIAATSYQALNYPEQHQKQIERKFAFNSKDAADRLSRIQKQADGWHIIDGWIYWVNICDINVLNKLELLGGCIHDGPFYRVEFNGDQAHLRNDPVAGHEPMKFRRDDDARKKYHEWGWLMTTSESLYYSQIQEWKGVEAK